MALWQFDATLEPESPANGSGTLFNRDDTEIIGAIDTILPRRNSWSDNLLMWGDESRDGIVVVLDSGRIVEINARIDSRRSPNPFVDQLVKLAKDCHAHLLGADRKVRLSTRARLRKSLRTSDSFKFVRDPRRYFEDRISTKPR